MPSGMRALCAAMRQSADSITQEWVVSAEAS